MKRFCFALDLKDDPSLIKMYEDHHQHVPTEILEGIKAVGILNMEIYRTGNRMFMVMETSDDFDFDKQMKLLGDLPGQKEWEALMWKFQQALPGAGAGEKWMVMQRIFSL